MVTARELAVLFENHVWKHHGVPTSIVSDRDVHFRAHLWQELNRRLGTKLCMSTAKHPQTDGQTENANGVLEDTL
jgi:transposase InsO family protein